MRISHAPSGKVYRPLRMEYVRNLSGRAQIQCTWRLALAVDRAKSILLIHYSGGFRNPSMRASSYAASVAVLFLLSGVVGLAQIPLDREIQPVAVDLVDRNVLWGANVLPPSRPPSAKSYLYRSADQGRTWKALRFGEGEGYPQIQQVAVDPGSGPSHSAFVLTSTPGKRLYLLEEDGTRFTNLTQNLPEGFVPASIRWLPSGELFLMASGSPISFIKSEDGGQTFGTPLRTPCTDGVEINYRSSSKMYCADRSTSRFRYSQDGGNTWNAGAAINVPNLGLNETLQGIEACQVLSDPSNADRLVGWCQTSITTVQSQRARLDVFYSSSNGLRSVSQLNWPTGLGSLVSPPNRRTIYATGAQPVRTNDFGASFVRLSNLPSPILPDPWDANIVYSSSSSGVNRSVDGGATFTVQRSNFVPAPANEIETIDQLLETGTAYLLRAKVKDIEGRPITASFFNPSKSEASTDVDFLKPVASTVPGVLEGLLVNAKGVAPGNYSAEATLRTGAIEVGKAFIRLEVVDKIAPRLDFRLQAVAGNGSFVNPTSTAGPAAGDGGPALSAPLACCNGSLAIGSDTSILLAETTRIRSISPSGAITTFAGSGATGSASEGDSAAQAKFTRISQILRSAEGILVLDENTRSLVAIRAPSNTVGVLWRGGQPLDLPRLGLGPRIALDGSNLLVSGNDAIYRSSDNGKTWSRLALYTDLLPGVSFFSINGLAVDRTGSMFLAVDSVIVRRTAAGVVSIVAGKAGTAGFAGDNGPAAQALLDSPGGLVFDSRGNLFFTDGYRVRVIYPDGVIQTIAGDGDTIGSKDAATPALATATSFASIAPSLTTDISNRLYANTGVRVYRLDPANVGGGTAPPQIQGDGIGSFVTGMPQTAPGAIFVIRGANFTSGGASASAANALQLPRVLAGASVYVNGNRAPILFASADRLHVQMPASAPVGIVKIQVYRDGTGSAEAAFAVVAVAPEIFTIEGDVTRALASDEAGNLIGPDNPAAAGSTVTVALTGTGTAVLSVDTAVLKIDGHEVPLAQLAASANAAGVVVAAIRIPDDLAAGDHEIMISVDGVASNTALIATK